MNHFHCSGCRPCRPSCGCGCRCFCCCPCCTPIRAAFTAIKRGPTGAPLAGAAYTLYRDGQPIATAVSDANGALSFSGLRPGVYTLVETAAPDGYCPDPSTHTVTVEGDGLVYIDGQIAEGVPMYNAYETPSAAVSFPKTDAATGLPLPGAAFTLSNGDTAVSDASGLVDFGSLVPGSYTLTESAAPDGYRPDPTVYTVIIAQDGSVSVNGIPLADFTVADQPLVSRPVSFRKIDAATGLPLPGAAFTLSNGDTAVSDASGLVDFGSLAPGTYTLTESAAPDGYQPDATVYTVIVAQDGSVAVNGIPLADFAVNNAPLPNPSPRPIIDSYLEGDPTIHGEGIPGAAIAVILPDGTTLNTTVADDGTWTISLPAGTVLVAGQTVYANQTVPGYDPSENASFLVQGRAR